MCGRNYLFSDHALCNKMSILHALVWRKSTTPKCVLQSGSTSFSEKTTTRVDFMFLFTFKLNTKFKIGVI